MLCSRGEEHEDVGGNESGLGAGPGVLHEGQDRHEVQQRLHEGPHAVPLQEHPPPAHGQHIQVTIPKGGVGAEAAGVLIDVSLVAPQGLPHVRLCLSHRGQLGGRDPRSQDHRVPRPRRAVLLDHRRPAPQEAVHLGVRQAQPEQHGALQEEAHLVRRPGIRRRMVRLLRSPHGSTSAIPAFPSLVSSHRDDPRFPTVRGVLRRGMTVEGLKQFIAAQVRVFSFFLSPRPKVDINGSLLPGWIQVGGEHGMGQDLGLQQKGTVLSVVSP